MISDLCVANRDVLFRAAMLLVQNTMVSIIGPWQKVFAPHYMPTTDGSHSTTWGKNMMMKRHRA